MNIENKNYISLIIWIISLMLIGSVIGSFTHSSVDSWYMTLDRSPLTPPNYCFGIAWSILYIMIAISGWLIWKSNHVVELHWIKKLYFIQLLLNWSWSPLFFNYQMIDIALICLMVIVILVAIIIIKTYRYLTIASLLLVPYLLWLLFATHLNFYIWINN